MPVVLTLSRAALSVVPGQPATLEARVRNVGTVVDAVSVDVIGVGWAQAVPPSAELLPGGEAVFTVMLQPPVGTAAGLIVAGVRAQPRQDVAGGAVEEVRIDVGVQGGLDVAVLPRTTADGGRAELHVTNTANVAQTVQFRVEDPELAVDVRFAAPSLTLQPRQEGVVPLVCRARKKGPRGQLVVHGFRVVAEGPHGSGSAEGAVQTMRRALPFGRALTALASFAIVAVAAVGGLLLWNQLSGKKTVPDVRRQPATAAATVLANAGFEMATKSQLVEDDAENGLVLAQDPAPNARQPKGSKVVLTVGQTTAKAAVPKMIGMTEAEARAALTGAGFFNVRVDSRQDDTPRGKVIDQQPLPGGPPLRPTDPIVVVVSAGPKAQPVPAVAGQGANEAVNALHAAGFTNVKIDQRFDADVAAGKVVGTEPADRAEPDAPILVIVSKGKESANVPNLVGKDVTAAFADMQKAGLKLGQVTYKTGDPDKVVDQLPEGGATVDVGSEVNLVIGRAASQPTSTITIPPILMNPSRVVVTGITLQTTTTAAKTTTTTKK